MLSVNDVLELLSIRLLGVIPDDEQILISANRGVPLTLDSANSPAAEAFRDIARRLTGEKVPIVNVEANSGGLLQRIARFFGRSG